MRDGRWIKSDLSSLTSVFDLPFCLISLVGKIFAHWVEFYWNYSKVKAKRTSPCFLLGRCLPTFFSIFSVHSEKKGKSFVQAWMMPDRLQVGGKDYQRSSVRVSSNKQPGKDRSHAPGPVARPIPCAGSQDKRTLLCSASDFRYLLPFSYYIPIIDCDYYSLHARRQDKKRFFKRVSKLRML